MSEHNVDPSDSETEDGNMDYLDRRDNFDSFRSRKYSGEITCRKPIKQTISETKQKPLKEKRTPAIGIVFEGLDHNERSRKQAPLKGTNYKSYGLYKSIGLVWVLFLILILCVLCTVCYYFLNNIHYFSNKSTEPIDRHMESLRKNFTNQDKLWPELESVMLKLHRATNNASSTIILLYNDRDISDCLATQVGNTLSGLLGNGRATRLHATAVRQEYSEFGMLLSEIQQQVASSGALVLYNLHELPGQIARALHTLCDDVNPVNRAAFVLTLNEGNVNSQLQPLQKAVKILNDVWIDLAVNIREPLIARLTGKVVNVMHEDKIPC